MGIKGDKHTPESEQVSQYLKTVLTDLGPITTKKMFGGHGIFYDGSMFGMVDSKGRSYLKAGGSLINTFEEAGFEKHSRMPYFLLPQSILEDEQELKAWATKSIQQLG